MFAKVQAAEQAKIESKIKILNFKGTVGSTKTLKFSPYFLFLAYEWKFAPLKKPIHTQYEEFYFQGDQ